MIKINEIKEEKLTPSQFAVIEKIKDFLWNLNNWYKIEANYIYVKDIEIFKKISEFINDENNPMIDGINYKYTEIKFLNNQNIVLEFDNWEYLKIINNISSIEYFKYIIKKILW